MDLREFAEWDPDALNDFGAELGRYAASVERVVDDIRSAGRFRGMWSGSAHHAAATRIVGLVSGIAAQSDSYRAVHVCAYRIAPRLRVLHTEFAEVRGWAAQRGLAVAADGGISAAPGANDDDLRVLHDRLDALLGRATDLDREAAAVLAEILVDDESSNETSGRGNEVDVLQFGGDRTQLPRLPIVPETGTDPAVVAQWWQRLDDFDRTALLAERPELIGPLDGLPADARDLANRALLDIERHRLEQVAEQLRSELDGNLFGGLLSNADAGLEQTSNKLAALDAIESTLARGDRQLLALDLSGREAMAAVAIGDVGTADHIAVYTPGAGSTVQGNLDGYDAQVSALRDEAHRQLDGAGPTGETVAAVTWMNYQAPHWGWGIAFSERSPVSDLAAIQAAPRLSGFLDGLTAARPDSPHVTAVGHSYGALVTSLALQQGGGVDAAVFTGAPGLGTGDIESLGLSPGAAYLVEADGDLIADAGTFGGDPSGLDGLTRLSSDPGTDAGGVLRTGSTGHSAYLDPGSMSSYNIAAVVAGTAERSAR